MKNQRVALIEFGGSHDECLLTQMEALQTAGVEIMLVTNQLIWDRNPHLQRFCSEVYFIEPKGKAIGDFLLLRKLVKFLKVQGVTKAVFNTAQGGHVRNLAFLLPKSIECYGIIHTIRKFQGSSTQKVINRAVKKYLVLSDDLLKRITPVPGITVSSFYPVAFPHCMIVPDKPEGTFRITITGGVENRRKDLHRAVEFIEKTPENIRFVFLGKTDIHHPDAKQFLEQIREKQLESRITYYTEFTDHTTFDAVLKQTDLLLPLIHPGTPSAEQYISNQISGAFTIAFGYKIPLLIHEAYSSEEDLKLSAYFYKEETFPAALQVALAQREALSEKISSVEKWKQEFQEQNYLRFLGL